MAGFHSRFPVDLILDTSDSMNGDPIEAVQQGCESLIGDLKNDPKVSDMTYLSIITFNCEAEQLFGLTDLDHVVAPKLIAGGSTALDEAFLKLQNAFANELRTKGTEQQRADYKPLVVLMTDGAPNTDDWKPIAKDLKASRIWYDLIVCGAGPGVDDDFLNFCKRELTESVLKLESLQPDMFRKFFKIIVNSIKLGSTRVQQNKVGGSVSVLPSQLSPGINLIP
jgi:uncharacterized protein YegL